MSDTVYIVEEQTWHDEFIVHAAFDNKPDAEKFIKEITPDAKIKEFKINLHKGILNAGLYYYFVLVANNKVKRCEPVWPFGEEKAEKQDYAWVDEPLFPGGNITNAAHLKGKILKVFTYAKSKEEAERKAIEKYKQHFKK